MARGTSDPPVVARVVRSGARRAALAIPPIRRLVGDRDRARTQLRAAKAELSQLRAAKAELTRLGPLVAFDRDDLQYVFVVTYGRSGSTLVQGLLNAIDGYQIRGENYGATIRLYRTWARLEEARGNFHTVAHTPEHPWYGVDGFDRELARARTRQLVLASILRPGPAVRVTGFKEIRWWPSDFEAYLRWMRATFPGARFIINTRDPGSVLASEWWADKEPAKARRQLEDYERKLDTLARMFPDDTFRLHYDDYMADPGVLEGLYRWLGEPWNSERVGEVMARKHSY